MKQGMIDKTKAKDIAQEELSRMSKKSLIELAIMDGQTIEFQYGWVFFYQSKKFLETNNMDCMVAGNAPFIIDKHDGSLHVTGTGLDIDFYIEEYVRNKLK